MVSHSMGSVKVKVGVVPRYISHHLEPLGIGQRRGRAVLQGHVQFVAVGVVVAGADGHAVHPVQRAVVGSVGVWVFLQFPRNPAVPL